MTLKELRRILWDINSDVDMHRIGEAEARRRAVHAMLDYIGDPDVDEANSRIVSRGRDRITSWPLHQPVGDPG